MTCFWPPEVQFKTLVFLFSLFNLTNEYKATANNIHFESRFSHTPIIFIYKPCIHIYQFKWFSERSYWRKFLLLKTGCEATAIAKQKQHPLCFTSDKSHWESLMISIELPEVYDMLLTTRGPIQDTCFSVQSVQFNKWVQSNSKQHSFWK